MDTIQARRARYRDVDQLLIVRKRALTVSLRRNLLEETERRLSLADFAANQLAGIVVILDDIDVTALLRIALDDRKLAVPEFFDLLRLAVKIVIVDFAG